MLEKLQSKVSAINFGAHAIFEQVEAITRLYYKKASIEAAVRTLIENYHAWSMGAQPLVKANLPDTADRFEELYDGAAQMLARLINGYGDLETNTCRFFEQAVATQLGIIRSIPDALEAHALGLRGIVARDFFDDELAAARHILENGYVREAGVIAGVVLERHLRLMCEKRSIAIGLRDTLGDLNNRLRASYPDDSEYRRVQMMNEMRASCAHAKGQAPDANKIGQLLSGVQAFIGTIS